MKVIYTILMAINLLSFFWLMAINTGTNMPAYLWIPRIVSAPLAIYLGKLWKDRGFRILAVYTLLFTIRSLIPNPNNLFTDDISQSILSALWLFAGCYGLARVLDSRQLKRFLLTCAVIWTVGMTVLSGIGIYAIWTSQNIPLLENSVIRYRIHYGVDRLALIYLPTTSGAILSVTVLIGLVSAISSKNRRIKGILGIAQPFLIIAMALTDSRTAFISVSAGIAVLAFILVYRHCASRETKDTSPKAKAKPWLFGTLAMVLCFAIVLFIMLRIVPVMNRIRTGGMIPAALAEGIEKAEISTRGLEGTSVLTGRTELWSQIMDYLRKNPIALLIGESKLFPLQNIDSAFAHCHNVYLQVLTESGIPGLLLVLAFIAWTIRNAIRVIQAKDMPTWIRLLPAIVISLWIADLVECFTWLRAFDCPITAVLFISAGILNNAIPNKSKKSSDTKA